ncbi:MAG: DUF222 domain-containing protein [Propionicimonas sp.]
MSESGQSGQAVPTLSARMLAGLSRSVRSAARPEVDAERIAVLRALEEMKATIAAVQAEVAVAFDHSQRAIQASQGVPHDQLGRGVAAQVALARRESPHAGGRLLGMAKALVRELPWTWAALRSGRLSEYRAMLVVRETACLSVEDRAAVDARVCGGASRVEDLGSRRLVAECRQAAYQLDPHSVVRRSAQAVSDRYVSLRPAPDTMTWLTALLPVAQGVAAYAALRVAADSARSAGDGRGGGQLMADTLVERLTGQATAEAVGVGVHLVMSDLTLLAADSAPAHLAGYGPIPAGVARNLVGASPEVAGWVRRLYQRPRTGDLVALDSRSRCFPTNLSTLITLRDQTCRTPWCDAPIRHVDHIEPHESGGATSFANGQGLCEACNHAKQAPGWLARPEPEGAQTVLLETPTGHRYRSRAPVQSGRNAEKKPSRFELAFRRLVIAA